MTGSLTQAQIPPWVFPLTLQPSQHSGSLTRGPGSSFSPSPSVLLISQRCLPVRVGARPRWG